MKKGLILLPIAVLLLAGCSNEGPTRSVPPTTESTSSSETESTITSETESTITSVTDETTQTTQTSETTSSSEDPYPTIDFEFEMPLFSKISYSVADRATKTLKHYDSYFIRGSAAKLEISNNEITGATYYLLDDDTSKVYKFVATKIEGRTTTWGTPEEVTAEPYKLVLGELYDNGDNHYFHVREYEFTVRNETSKIIEDLTANLYSMLETGDNIGYYTGPIMSSMSGSSTKTTTDIKLIILNSNPVYEALVGSIGVGPAGVRFPLNSPTL